MSSPITIQFCGAACEVTGSMHLLTIDDKKILLDAGAFQGSDAKDKNSAPLAFDPVEIDYIFLTHAHYDHTGRLPMLCQRGFKGEIISTPATREITFRIMDDSLRIQKEEGEELLFSEEDVKKAKSLFVPVNVDYPQWQDDEKKIKIKNDALILDENDLRRKGIQIPDRPLISGQLEDLLKRSSLMEPANLQSSLNRVFTEIK
jgi:Cft2 family RNA processing exonuclease